VSGIKLSAELKQKLINGGHSEALIVYDDEVFMKADRMQIRVNHTITSCSRSITVPNCCGHMTLRCRS
jgi:hypothetical protein